MPEDPVCGMHVDPGDAAGRIVYRGAEYHFCADSCSEKFERQPEKYAGEGNCAPPDPEGAGGSPLTRLFRG